MEFARLNKDKLIQAYVTEGKSSYQIAEELKTTSSKVLKALTYLGIPRRSGSQAQKNALEKGRTKHPTKGKKMSEESKFKISQARAKIWSEMSQEERDRFCQTSKDKWANMTDSEREEMQRLAAEAVRIASKEGSKMEKYLRDYLKQKGKFVQFHVKNLIQDEKLEVDMFLPDIKTAIEIDGPAHFLPIWGELKLQKHQKADAAKSGLLLANGYKLLRVKQVDKTLSKKRMYDLANIILEIVEKIESKENQSNLIEIEVKDGKIC